MVTPMTRPVPPALALVALLVAVLAVACGGGDDSGAGKGQRVTDPAAVPTSTPISPQIIYKISGDVVTAAGGTPSSIRSGSPTAAAQGKTYKVEGGDTCSKIAGQFGISVEDLIKANRTINSDCTNLRAGDELRIAAVTASGTTATGGAGTPTPKPSGKEHKVVSGETCDEIARSFNVDAKQLIALNGLNADCTDLQAGQTIRIP
jgi:LysM repeat protein